VNRTGEEDKNYNRIQTDRRVWGWEQYCEWVCRV